MDLSQEKKFSKVCGLTEFILFWGFSERETKENDSKLCIQVSIVNLIESYTGTVTIMVLDNPTLYHKINQ